MIKIKVTGGLCNRLRALFSYYKKSCADKTTLFVIWVPDKFCNGYFLDYFKSIKNVKFTNEDLNIKLDYVGGGLASRLSS